MKAALLIGALGISWSHANLISCDRPYGCSGHNDVKLTCDNNEDCAISCADEFACRDLDIYGPTNELSDDQLSLTIDCTGKYACYGVKLHTDNLDTIRVQCTDWWSCAYMTIEGQTANQVMVYVPDDGYYSFGSGRVYCPLSTENIDSSEIACSIECNGEKSCYHSKFHNNNGMINNELVIGCNGDMACNFAKLYCSYDSESDEWSKQCTMSCETGEVCGCESESDCMA